MPSSNATITGLDELNAKLAGIPGAYEKVARKALRKSAEIVQKTIQGRAPIRPPLPSGTALPPGALAADINIGSVRKIGPEAFQIRVAPGKYTNHIARMVEYGHRQVRGGRNDIRGKGPQKGAHIGDVPAHPFIRPGYEASEALAAEVLIATFREEAKKAWANPNDSVQEIA